MKVHCTGSPELNRRLHAIEEAHGLYFRRTKEEAALDTERDIDVLVSSKTNGRPIRCWKRVRDGARKACKRLRKQRDDATKLAHDQSVLLARAMALVESLSKQCDNMARLAQDSQGLARSALDAKSQSLKGLTGPR